MARIIVIDDEGDVRVVVKEVLNRAGYEVEVASDGREGLEMLKANGADLVITDIIMPGQDGISVLYEIRESHPGMPVIVISGGGNIAPMEYEPVAIKTTAYLASASEAGANLTLTKPFSREELLDAVSKVLQ